MSTSDSQRKTAHSKIEKRRREKTNATLAALKKLLPDCEKREMAKLGDYYTNIADILEEALKYILKLTDQKQITRIPSSPPLTVSGEQLERFNVMNIANLLS